MADFTSFTTRQLQHVADTGFVKQEGMIIDVLPLAWVDDEATNYDGVSFTVQHPLANFDEVGAGAILAYGEHPKPGGNTQRASVVLNAHRVACRYEPIIRGFNNDPNRLARLEQLGPIQLGKVRGIMERQTADFLFDSANYSNVDVTASASLEALDPDENIFVTMFSALRAGGHYRYRNLMGASLEGFIYRDDLPILGEFLEITGVLGRESATATVRLNPGGLSDERIAQAIMSRLRLDALHVIEHAPNSAAIALAQGAAQGLINPTTDTSGVYTGTALSVHLMDRSAAAYNLRTDDGKVLKPRFGPIITTAGNGLNCELLSDYDGLGRIEKVWAECSYGIADITQKAADSNSAFDDIPQGIIFNKITP